jgi:hypothetical protein
LLSGKGIPKRSEKMGLFHRRRKPDAASGPAEGRDAESPVQSPANAPRTVHERIEVTVERVWVSMVVRNSQAASTVEGAAAEADLAAEVEMMSQKMLEAPDAELPKGD